MPKTRIKEFQQAARNENDSTTFLFGIPALLECCPFPKTAPRNRPAAKHINK